MNVVLIIFASQTSDTTNHVFGGQFSLQTLSCISYSPYSAATL